MRVGAHGPDGLPLLPHLLPLRLTLLPSLLPGCLAFLSGGIGCLPDLGARRSEVLASCHGEACPQGYRQNCRELFRAPHHCPRWAMPKIFRICAAEANALTN
jgi:hypothetical protein